MKDEPMNSDPEMREDYDFAPGVRGKYFERIREASNVVILDPDVAADFPDSEAVNAALRGVQRERRRPPKSRASAPSRK